MQFMGTLKGSQETEGYPNMNELPGSYILTYPTNRLPGAVVNGVDCLKYICKQHNVVLKTDNLTNYIQLT